MNGPKRMAHATEAICWEEVQTVESQIKPG